MLHSHELEQQLIATLDDDRLSKEEKRELNAVARICTDQQRRFLRNKAFDLFRENFLGENKDVITGTTWLEKTLKSLNPIDTIAPYNEVFFSPGNLCRDKIVALCNHAKTALDICVFTISDNVITEAILNAHQRQVPVRIITDNDKSENRGSDIDYLLEKGVAIRMDATEYHMHHKFALIDNSMLINGSFNWTRSATERNQENILVSNDNKLIAPYQDKFDNLWNTYQR